ncbi:hypothetical protein Q5P01_001074 [Channa striata]|uniref:Uncharacterized protein n=1 Tax=Channa striata TaxID=64152 RepID=A0AA88T2G9_CHASR|nr:hypothetical protein Q5P01_001074 [Channa striata]
MMVAQWENGWREGRGEKKRQSPGEREKSEDAQWARRGRGRKRVRGRLTGNETGLERLRRRTSSSPGTRGGWVRADRTNEERDHKSRSWKTRQSQWRADGAGTPTDLLAASEINARSCEASVNIPLSCGVEMKTSYQFLHLKSQLAASILINQPASVLSSGTFQLVFQVRLSSAVAELPDSPSFIPSAQSSSLARVEAVQ